ncbi:DUF2147 domain-containing protein [Acinetobacter sp. NIPH 1958]|uniref:DUF2147 domain-containing protein n=1 Tax=unclassified Acinetobacter TaxID=196816 RepID=UPI00051914A1|nr:MULTISPECIES: DUF2147 domain-containing protein [unclassified Acinetobacter]MCH7351159.1 DUF2147 domain-containing protein [Acinetobacter sp. NIPH 2023]MCH7356479.1 DUF2147 domain-containing protein [Acinetobacter sp. NIPH 1958]MCH7359012.1 DUF2147 domain-containing protein [Acinetobacter sp. NIPH 2024]
MTHTPFFRACVLLLGLSAPLAIHAAPTDPLIGTWKVVDERTGTYLSDIVIRRHSATEQYSAVIVKMYPSAKEAAPTLCTACSGTLKNQPIIGMEVLTGLKMLSQNEEFGQGVWINPYDGYKYSLNARLSKTGKMLSINAKNPSNNSFRNMTWIRL